MCEKNRINRRTILKGTGITLTSSTLMGSVTAQNSSKDSKSELDRPNIQKSETVAEKNGVEVKKIVIDGEIFFFRHNFGDKGQISYVKVTSASKYNSEISASEALSLTSPKSEAVETTDVTTQEEVVEQSEGIKKYIGGCDSWYSDHYYVGATLKFADNIDAIGVSALAGVLCTALSRRFGGKFGEDALNKLLDYVLGGGCSVLANIVVDKISGFELTVGFYDIDTGSLDWPEIGAGVSGQYDDDYGNLSTEASTDGSHIHTEISL